MRKLLIIALAVSALGFAGTASADEYVKGGFELSGHVNAGLGFQRTTVNAGTLGAINAAAAAQPFGPIQYGPMGEFSRNQSGFGALTGSDSSFNFFLDDIALGLSKSFGENIRVRADLDFGRVASGAGTAASFASATLQQGYVTANIPVGNGVEFMVGRFFAPIGFEKVYRNENNTVTHSIIWNLRSTNLTGAKIYYAFNDLIDWHFYVVNNLRDAIGAGGVSKDLPGFGTRLGFNWGDEGKKNTVGVSAQAGPESTGNVTGGLVDKMGNQTYVGDVDWNVHVNDQFTIGGEALFRVDMANKTLTKQKTFGGVLDLNYAFTDVWDGTLKYAYARQNDATLNTGTVEGALGAGGLINSTGARTWVQQFALAGQYQIADGAKLQSELRLDYVKPVSAGKTMVYGAVVNFAYQF